MNEIIKKIKSAIVWMTLFFALVLMICIGLLTFDAVTLNNISNFSVIMFNFFTPIVLFAGTVLLFLAFYVQKYASNGFKKELSVLRKEITTANRNTAQKELLEHLTRDIENFKFTVPLNQYNNNTLEPDSVRTHKGIYGMCCYLADYYAGYNKSENTLTANALMAQRFNNQLITSALEQFAALHNFENQAQSASEDLCTLQQLLEYTYTSKLKYAVEIIIQSRKKEKLETAAQFIYALYN